MSRQLKSYAVYALWGVAAAGILAAVRYVVLARSGEANNPGDIIAEDISSVPEPAQPTPTPADSLVGVSDNTMRAPDQVAIDIYRLGRSANDFSIGLYWSQVSGAVRYDVERDRGDGYASLGWIDAALVSENLNVASPTRVAYRVRACADEAGADCGPWSDAATGNLQPLVAPTGLTATAGAPDGGNFTVNLSWSGQDTGTRYRIERDTGAGWQRAGQANHPASTYADTVAATQAVTVRYRVMDCEDDACSAASNTASVDLNP